jgi:hypothetical protein
MTVKCVYVLFFALTTSCSIGIAQQVIAPAQPRIGFVLVGPDVMVKADLAWFSEIDNFMNGMGGSVVYTPPKWDVPADKYDFAVEAGVSSIHFDQKISDSFLNLFKLAGFEIKKIEHSSLDTILNGNRQSMIDDDDIKRKNNIDILVVTTVNLSFHTKYNWANFSRKAYNRNIAKELGSYSKAVVTTRIIDLTNVEASSSTIRRYRVPSIGREKIGNASAGFGRIEKILTKVANKIISDQQQTVVAMIAHK